MREELERRRNNGWRREFCGEWKKNKERKKVWIDEDIEIERKKEKW